MPKCTYNKNHETKSTIYCFQCSKYLCEECINIHKISFEEKNHIFIKQYIINIFEIKKVIMNIYYINILLYVKIIYDPNVNVNIIINWYMNLKMKKMKKI